MLKLLQVSFRRQVWRNIRSVAGPGAAGRTADRMAAVRTCVVDPNLEERFVFLDCAGVEEEPDEEQQLRAASGPGPGSGSDPGRHRTHLRVLDQQLQVLRHGASPGLEPDGFMEPQDQDFPLDRNLIRSQKKKRRKKGAEPEGAEPAGPEGAGPEGAGPEERGVFGSVSASSCSGCGARLHCAAADLPGFLPRQKFAVLMATGKVGGATCQRCHLLKHQNQAPRLQLSRDQYRAVVQRLRAQKALVLLVVDLLDPPGSLVPDLPDLVGPDKRVVVVGNKVDLLPGDAPDYLRRLKRRLAQCCRDAGFGPQVSELHLVSAQTGFGLEGLVSALQRRWSYRGDVVLVGGANAGKSTLFNALLESDYCRAGGAERRATVSPWPGTTLELLRFPITNPTPYRMFRRQKRLKEEEQQTEAELPAHELQRLQRLSRHGYLVGRVGQTFRSGGSRSNEIQFDPDSLAIGEDGDSQNEGSDPVPPSAAAGSHDAPDLRDAHWLLDTPGILRDRDILQLLEDQEIRAVVPTRAIVPRTFVLKPGMTLFVGALARIDFLQGRKSCWFSVLASSRVPVHVTGLEKAAGVYERHAGGSMLGVPSGGSDRMLRFPPLVPQDFSLEGKGHQEATADITLSSAGWVAVTAPSGERVALRVHGPEAAGFGLRTPPLLPHVAALRGQRRRGSAAHGPPPGAGRVHDPRRF